MKNLLLDVGGMALAAAITILALMPQAFGQEPPDRLDMDQAAVVQLIAQQTEVMSEMSEALSRIETLVIDTNQKVATQADVKALMDKLEAMKLNVAPKTDTVSEVVTRVAPVIRERIVAIDGVPVVSSDPCATLNQTATECVPTTPTPQLPYTIKTARPFNRSSVTIDPNTGQSAVHIKTPFQRIQTSTPSLPTPELPSRPNLPGCLGGRCSLGPSNQAYGNEYNPATVTTPRNDLGRTTTRRRGFLGRLFGRR